MWVNMHITILVYTCWQNKQPQGGLASARGSSCLGCWLKITMAFAWQPPALPQKTQQLNGARPVTSQGEASLLSAGPEQQMLGMNISGILSPRCTTISMNQMWRAKIFTSCVSRGIGLHFCDVLVWQMRFGQHCIFSYCLGICL